MRVPHDPSRASTQRGFTLVELLGVVAIILLLTVVGLPAFTTWIDQQRLTGFVSEASVQLVRARQEAVQRGVPVIAQPDPIDGSILVWADVDENDTFNPNPSALRRTVDYQLARLFLPTRSVVVFNGPGGTADMIDGLTIMPSGANAFVFEPDGSVRDTGGLRISDEKNNYLELRVDPKATGKTRVLKYNSSPSWGDAAEWYEKANVPSTGAPTWVWY